MVEGVPLRGMCGVGGLCCAIVVYGLWLPTCSYS